ncbi:alpha/beta fold hydrolase [Marivibrio halodurans]|nr:alpha/beta fold hydrolase [Marivibrio halodurans]
MGPPIQPPSLAGGAFTMADGYHLPYRRWGTPGTARAIVLGLHGFNDYSAFLSNAGPVWAERDIATFAYDQRGFGETAGRGLWHGRAALIADARAVAGLIRARYPDRPLFLLGESMGGAVAIAAVSGRPHAAVAGTVLTAPAAADWQGFAWYQRWSMWAAAHTLPWLEVTGQGLRLQPSDNIAMLRALSRDPLVIKRTRIDALWGLLRLGDRAFDVADSCRHPRCCSGARERSLFRSAPGMR